MEYQGRQRIKRGNKRHISGTVVKKQRNTPHQVQVRMIQLLVCLAIFLTVYIGKGVFPQRIVALSDDVRRLISTTMDFRGSFSRLGESLVGEESVLGEIGSFFVTVFESDKTAPAVPVTGDIVLAQSFLTTNPTTETLAIYYLPDEIPVILNETETEVISDTGHDVAPASTQTASETAIASAVLPVGAVVELVDITLPTGYTPNRLSLGWMDISTPVIGVISSPYGYRDHPLFGGEKMHNGVDIVGNTGDPIRAFSDGVVEYTGESEIYGLYFQIDHGNGITTFYAHCSELLVKKGQKIIAGETVAKVGATGNVTGAHLHFELRYDGIFVDPEHYIVSKEL